MADGVGVARIHVAVGVTCVPATPSHDRLVGYPDEVGEVVVGEGRVAVVGDRVARAEKRREPQSWDRLVRRGDIQEGAALPALPARGESLQILD